MANLTKFTYSSHLSLLFFFFLLISSIQSQPIISTDPSFYYNLCAPSRCNNLTLPYPFTLPNSCYPSIYKPSCRNNQSLLLTNSFLTDANRVLSLNYNDPNTAIVQVASDSLFTCGAQVSRPDYRAVGTIFSLPSTYTRGTHLNCTAPIPTDSIRGLQNASCLGCNGQDPNNVCYYAPGFVSYPTTCENFNIFTPGGPFNASGVRDLRAFLQSGFEVRYVKPAECSGCERSGGRCGSQPISGSFVCFCTSSVHRLNCLDECRGCETSGGRCGAQPTSGSSICYCPYSVHRMNCSDGSQEDLSTWVNGPGGGGSGLSKAAVAVLAIGIGGLLAAAVIFLIWRSKQSPTKSIIFWKRSDKAQILVEEFLKSYGSLAPKRYIYSDIKKITNSFKDKVGKGGYGFVYKGKLLDGRLVAVKLLNKAKGDGEEFINEVGSITRTSHVNVVSLLGFCFEGSKRALIYEFMPNGSLEKFIYDPNPLEAQSQLGWEMLYQIAIGVARGLEYLHRGCNTRILHFDIKPHNILLDHDFTPKISDFGLAKLCLNKESVISMLDARGTAGYIAPEVFNRNFGGVSNKSDVYSYGMMVLEIVGGRKNFNVQVDHTSEIYFPQWIYNRLILDVDLELYGVTSQEETEIAKKMILVALWCIQTNPIDRPSMSKVVEMFEGPNELLQIPPKPYLCSPPRSPIGSSNT